MMDCFTIREKTVFPSDRRVIGILPGSKKEAYDNFGIVHTSVGSDKVLIGAYRDDTGADDAGTLYLYEVVPTLDIQRAPVSGVVIVSWEPETATGWVLQSTPSLRSTNWINSPSGTNNPAVGVAGGLRRFFRLHRP